MCTIDSELAPDKQNSPKLMCFAQTNENSVGIRHTPSLAVVLYTCVACIGVTRSRARGGCDPAVNTLVSVCVQK